MKVKNIKGFPKKNMLSLELKYCSMEVHRKHQDMSGLFNSIRNDILEEIGELTLTHGRDRWKLKILRS